MGGIEECGGRGKHVTRLAACRLPRCMKAHAEVKNGKIASKTTSAVLCEGGIVECLNGWRCMVGGWRCVGEVGVW